VISTQVDKITDIQGDYNSDKDDSKSIILVFIISGTGAAIWSKPNFGHSGHHHLKVVPFHMYAPFPTLLQFFKCILKFMFCEGAQQNSLVKKGNVKKWAVVIEQPGLLLPKFRVRSLNIFTQSLYNITIVYGIDCLVYQNKFVVNDPLDVKENDKNALDFSLHLPCHFQSVSLGFSIQTPMYAIWFLPLTYV
jgi:hypothetical protein